MKKFLTVLLLAISLCTVACARDRHTRDVNELPVAARSILKNNFKAQVSLIKIDTDWGRVSEYEVVLTDGTEVTFDRAGNWKEIDTGFSSSVPDKLIPKTIRDYVKANQKGTKVVGIEHGRKGYEVTLSNGIEMKFDSQGRFLRYDD